MKQMTAYEILTYEIKKAEETLSHQKRLITGLTAEIEYGCCSTIPCRLFQNRQTDFSVTSEMRFAKHILDAYDKSFPLPRFEEKYYHHSTLFMDEITPEEENIYWLLVGSTIEEIMQDASEMEKRRPMWSEGNYLLDTLQVFYPTVTDFLHQYKYFWSMQNTRTYYKLGPLWLDTLMDYANMQYYLDQLLTVKEMRDDADFLGKRLLDEDILYELGHKKKKRQGKILQLFR
jgi:hypothetical protein